MTEMKRLAAAIGLSNDVTTLLLAAPQALGSPFSLAVDHFLSTPSVTVPDVLASLADASGAASIHPYTLAASFVLAAFAKSRAEFSAEYGEEIYLDTARDLSYKITECRNRYGIVGTSSGSWYTQLLRRNILALGRLQFHTVPLYIEDYQDNNLSLKKEDLVIKIHIPSSGKLYEEDCLDAYRRAYRLFRPRFKSDIVPFVCFTWLLDPAIAEVAPSGGLAAFASHFKIFRLQEDEKGLDLFRIFGKDVTDLDSLPTETTLQRAFADRLRAGKHLRIGYGIFAHDGQNIIK